METHSSRDDRITALAALDQPLRRQLHALLVESGEWVSRDEAAAALGVARSVAAFHLDKLADAGVVEVSFERTTGRTGPGAGRTAKLYRLADDELSASVPERRYDLAAQLLADAVAGSAADGGPVAQQLEAAARDAGLRIGAECRGVQGGSGILDVLEQYGYDPCPLDDGQIALVNCPFHRLAERHRSLVCGMNLDFLSGVVDGLDPDPTLQAELRPEPGWCCVRLRTR
ncbi:helix-turn-helix transcriptional regulator [Aquihabitans daechungensis]|uniref:helix-turn-helix transcriptional regulator n=1 Tax=Aquihabitans daechungensis TaxID=1052257 RepID=UPI003BA3027F